jgi:hypothetical protein
MIGIAFAPPPINAVRIIPAPKSNLRISNTPCVVIEISAHPRERSLNEL